MTENRSDTMEREREKEENEKQTKKRKQGACMSSESTMISDQGLNRRRVFALISRGIFLAHHVFER